MKYTRFAQAWDTWVKDMWRRVHLLNYFVLKFHVLLNFEPIYSRLTRHSILTSVNSPIIATPESAPIIAFPVLQLYERRHQLLSMLNE